MESVIDKSLNIIVYMDNYWFNERERRRKRQSGETLQETFKECKLSDEYEKIPAKFPPIFHQLDLKLAEKFKKLQELQTEMDADIVNFCKMFGNMVMPYDKSEELLDRIDHVMQYLMEMEEKPDKRVHLLITCLWRLLDNIMLYYYSTSKTTLNLLPVHHYVAEIEEFIQHL